MSALPGTFSPTGCPGGLGGTSWLRIESLGLLGSLRDCPDGSVSYSFFPFLPRKSRDTTKADDSPLCHQSLWLTLGQMVGSLPFPAKANSLSAALAPLSCARRRDKSQTCLLTAVSSTFPSSPGLITLRTELAEGQALSHKWIRFCRNSIGKQSSMEGPKHLVSRHL